MNYNSAGDDFSGPPPAWLVIVLFVATVAALFWTYR